MKKTLTLFLLLFFVIGSSQNVRYQLAGFYLPPITKEKLNSVKLATDLISNCPTHWDKIIDYVSFEILTTQEGKYTSTKCKSNVLSLEQKNALNEADFCSDITIKISFKYKDTTSALGDYGAVQRMDYRVTFVPDVEAEYVGGALQMKNYLNETLFSKVKSTIDTTKNLDVIVKFAVNENGKIADIKIDGKATDPKMEKLVFEAMNKMPQWKAAKNSKGVKVKQDFEFKIVSKVRGGDGC